jgi:hypothetical protein
MVLRAVSWDERTAEYVRVGWGEGWRADRHGAGLGKGEIVAVRRRALTLSRWGTELNLWSVVAAEHGPAPATLVADVPSDFTFHALGLRRGDEARLRGCSLWLGEAVEIDLSHPALWLPPKPPSYRLPEAWKRLAEALVERPPRGGLEGLVPHAGALLAGGAMPARLDPLGERAWRALADLLVAWRATSWAAVTLAASRLAGLGPGLTPAGDDLLAGLLVAYSWGAGAPLAERTRRFLVECAEACRPRTSSLGYQRLRYAAGGLLDDHSMAVLPALWRHDETALRAAVDRAWAIGHSSGADTLTGLVIGLALGDELGAGRR